ncbi:MAG: hypothetical protein WD431_00735 [Cyclobacteriaceae bacterium]
MTGYIHQWKAFIEGVLTEKEARNFLQTLDNKETQKALEDELARVWKELPHNEFESEIAGIIQRFKKKTKPFNKNGKSNYKVFNFVIKWAALFGVGLFFLFKQIDYFAFPDRI